MGLWDQNEIIFDNTPKNIIEIGFIKRIFPNSRFKYKNPPMSKDTVVFELFINWNEPIVLVEGSFDAIAVR